MASVRALGGEQHEPPLAQGVLEGRPRRVTGQRYTLGVVHRGPFQALIVEDKATRFNDIDADIEASGQTYNRTSVLRDIGLEKR